MFLKIFGFIFLIIGILVVFAASWIVKRYNMDRSVTCDYEHEMNEEELADYKRGRAVLNMKMLGMLIALPGFILIFLAYR